MNFIVDILLHQDLIFIIPLVSFIYCIYLGIEKIKIQKNIYYKILEITKYLIFSIQLYILVFFILVILLHIISPEYRSGSTSGPGMGPAFGHGIMIALLMFFILPLSFVINGIVQYIQSKIQK